VSVRRALLSIATAFGLAACATPALRPLPAADPRPEALLARWSAEVEDRQALRGIAKLALDAERSQAGPLRLRSKQRLVVARPGRLRVEVQGFLGATLAVLAIDEGRYAFFQSEDRHYESGPVYPALLRDVVGLDLSPPDTVDVILGAPPVGADPRIRAAFDLGDGLTRIELVAEGAEGRRTLDLDEDARLRRFLMRNDAGDPLWEARFDEYAPVAGTPVAHRVSLTLPAATAVLALSRVELNPSLDPDIFRLDPIAAPRDAVEEGG
jgi:outer membrane biogenesis lipoprotein LolB